MKYVVVDIEADGPIPGKYSMVSLGAVFLDDLSRTFYAELAPISSEWVPNALAVSGFTREQTLSFVDPKLVMASLWSWLNETSNNERCMMVADNAGFDWQFVNWYFHMFLGENPFGHSSISITSMWKGFDRNMRTSFKHLRKRTHTHNALDDAIGNAEALRTMSHMGIKGLLGN